MKPLQALLFHGHWKPVKTLRRRLERHKNPGLEIVLITKGEFWWQVEGRREKVKPETIFYTLPWQEHGGVGEVQPNAELFYICLALAEACDKPRRTFEFHPAFGFAPSEEREISSALVSSSTHALRATPDADWLMRAAFHTLEEASRLGQRPRAQSLLKLLVIELARCASEQHPNAIQHDPADEAERRVRKFVEMLRGRYREPWTLESMSQASRLRRTHFAQLLKRHTGDSPVTFLNRLRVERACEMLTGTGKSITEIAFETGFNSSQYFATVFRQFVQADPRSLRKRL